MNDIVIRAENLGKKYVIGHRSPDRAHYTALRDVIARQVRGIGRSAMDMVRGRPNIEGDEIEEFWALSDVDFEIGRGDVTGIVGRNGAGKSTLLKILSRITEPTQGRVAIRGRVASLLEVGTGFHPELTGRENIYLNGAILGMSRSEIRCKFDAIVDFAGAGQFIDTPVKRYSSGMHVRLAFSVAAHLEPEILVIDEVLAVGDAEFQKRCLGKMKDTARAGRTVLFVSHNMGAVSSLCHRGMLLEKGRIAFSGTAAEVVERYGDVAGVEYDAVFAADPARPAITRVTVDQHALSRRDLRLAIHFRSPAPLPLPIGGVVLRGIHGAPVWGSNGRFHPRSRDERDLREGVIICEADNLPLLPGQYLVSVWLAEWGTDHDAKLDCIKIDLGREGHDGPLPPVSVNGHLDWPAKWRSSRMVAKPLASAAQ